MPAITTSPSFGDTNTAHHNETSSLDSLTASLLLIVAWRFWSPANLSACTYQNTAPGPLTAVIRNYFEGNNRIDWRDMDDRFDILSTPEGQKIAGEPKPYTCEALQILQSPAFSQSEKSSPLR